MSETTDRKRKWDEPAGDTQAPVDPRASEAAAAAAAIAAKIAASLRAPGTTGGELVKVKEAEGDYVKDIEINDLRNRYVLTKGSTQHQIQEETGCSITTKGIWVPDRTKAATEPPLYLHIVAKTQAILDAAVEKVNELINQDLGPLIDDRTLVARNRAMGLPPPPGAGPRVREKWPEEKLHIGLDSLRNFNIRAKTVGPGGMFVKFIQAETGARVQIKGIGSGFMEAETGRESDEPMHINIAGPDMDQIRRAKELAEDLLVVLRIEYEKARMGGTYVSGYQGALAPDQPQGGQDAYAAYYAQYGQQPPTEGTPGSQPPATPAPGQEGDAQAQYAAYWAAYGYDVNDPAFQAWQATQYGQPGAATPAQ
ncbi:hypothetical protein P7C73_g5760, partial [Tremellales sp. Uapishka_1]